MALQQLFNLASSLEINRRKLVGVQYTRSEVPKTSLSPTKNPWRFKMSIVGQPWDNMRTLIEQLDHLDRYTPELINLGFNSTFSWLYRYRGSAATTPTTLTVDTFTTDTLVVNNVGTLGLNAGDLVFAAGDMIQIVNSTNPEKTAYPFTCVEDVMYDGLPTVTVQTHRPNILPSDVSISGAALNVAENCQIYMFCPQMPVYKLIPGAARMGANGQMINNAIVEWSDDFELYEFLPNNPTS